MSAGSGALRARELGAFALASTVLLALAALPWLSRAGEAVADPGATGTFSAAADARLLAWVLAWNGHAAWAQPTQWFDANIFHPARNMLAGSESLLGLLPLSLPIGLLTDGPLRLANLTAWLTYPAAAIAMYAYLRLARFAWLPSAVGAVLFCFGPFRLPGDLRVLQLPAFFLPLLSIAMQTSRPGRRVPLPVVTLLALTSSLYMGAMSVFVWLVELAFALRERGVRAAVGLVVSVLPILPLLAIVQWPYVRQAETIPASLDPLAGAGVVADLYWHGMLFGESAWRETVAVAIVLGAVGLLSPLIRRRRPDTAWWRSLAFLMVGLLIAAGPSLNLLGFEIPLPLQLFAGTPFGALRAFQRFLVLASFGLCGFAAAGAACLLDLLRARVGLARLAPIVGGVLLLVPGLLGARAMYASPLSALDLGADVDVEVDRILAASSGAVLEIPPPLPGQYLERALQQANFMLRSTRHWRPLVNGHTGYVPWWHKALLSELSALPDPAAVEAVSELTAVEWIVVHEALMSAKLWAEWRQLPARLPWLRPELDRDGVLLLHVARERRTRWADALALGAKFRGHSALGTPLRPLEAAGAWARLSWATRPPARVRTGRATVEGVLRLRNLGTDTWPALLRPEAPDDHLVVAEATWSRDGRPEGPPLRLRLPRDVLPGDRVRVPFELPVPDEAGVWTLTFRARQVGGAQFLLSNAASARIEIGEE